MMNHKDIGHGSGVSNFDASESDKFRFFLLFLFFSRFLERGSQNKTAEPLNSAIPQFGGTLKRTKQLNCYISYWKFVLQPLFQKAILYPIGYRMTYLVKCKQKF